MRAVVQRVSSARVTVDSNLVGEIGPGLLVLLGIAVDDTPRDVDWLADKILNLRIFSTNSGKIDRSLLDTGGSLLVVSQFTLFADTRKGRRPAFTDAARPEIAVPLYEAFIDRTRASGVPTETGRFGAEMAVDLVNQGPVTILLDSRNP